MIATLNPFRDTLEELGSVLGVIDAVSGPVVLGLKEDSVASKAAELHSWHPLLQRQTCCVNSL
jgi:hypothetical protein